jgi:hypothetical protein
MNIVYWKLNNVYGFLFKQKNKMNIVYWKLNNVYGFLFKQKIVVYRGFLNESF